MATPYHYPKKEVPLQAPKSLFWEHAKFPRSLTPKVHTSHTYFGFSILGHPCTMLDVDNNLSPLKLRCPRQRCHFHDSFFTSPWKHFSVVELKWSGNIQFWPIWIFATNLLLVSFKTRESFYMCIIYPFSRSCPILRILLFMLGT